MLAYLPEERPSIPYIRSHAWMKRSAERKIRRRRINRHSAPVAKKLMEIPTTSNSSESGTIHDLEYERLCERVSECSLKNEIGGDSKHQPFWKNLLEKVKLNKSPSFHFLPSALLTIRNKVAVMKKLSTIEDQLKDIIEQILKHSPCSHLGKKQTRNSFRKLQMNVSYYEIRTSAASLGSK